MARICPIFEEGDEGEVKKVQGVALLDVGYKVLANILAKRLAEEWMKEKGMIGKVTPGLEKQEGLGTIYSY